MADLAKLGIEVSGKGIKQVGKELKDLVTVSKKTETATEKLKSSFTGLKSAAGALAGAFAVREILMTGNAFVQVASAATETQNKFSVVFSSIRDEAEQTADVLARSYGMSDQAAKESLSAVGDLLTGLGLQQQAALDLANQTVQLGTDLASFTNYAGGAKGATEALTKAMLGETEMAKSLGLVLGENQMAVYAESVGKTWSQLGLAEKAQLRLNAAIAQSPNAVGDFARSSGELANQQRIAVGIIEDMQQAIGSGLLPAVRDSIKVFTDSRTGLNEFATVVGGVFAKSLTDATKPMSTFVDQSGKLKTTGLSEFFVQVAGGVKLFTASLDAGLTSISQGLSDLKKLATFDFFGPDTTKETNEFATAMLQASDNVEAAWKMIKNPVDFVRVALFDAEEQAKKTAAAVSVVKPPPSGGGDAGGASVTALKARERALDSISDKYAELTMTAQEFAVYEVNQWYESKAAIVGYTDELKKTRDEWLKYLDTQAAEKAAKVQAQINQQILSSEIATAQQRIAVINSVYDAKVAAATQYGLDATTIEAERSIKIQAIWEADAEKHGSMVDGFVSGINKYGEDAGTAYQRAQSAGLAMANSLESGIGSMLSVTGQGLEDWGNKAMNVITSVVDAVMQATVVSPFTEAITSGIGSFTSSMFGGGGSPGWSQTGAIARAKGAVFPGGDISKYSGSVVSSPTFFTGKAKAFASGGNVMGEAGPEAILPLERTSSGALGVQAVGGGGSGDVTINVYNQGQPMDAETRTSQDTRGGTSIDVFLKPIKDAVAQDMATNGTMLNKAAKFAVGANDRSRPGMGGGF